MNIRRPQLAARKSRGVTLLELMVGLIIISIGMTIAIPSFQGMTARNRIAVQVNEMLLAINLARSEATRTGSSVSIQAVAPSSDNEFGGGWCVVPGDPGDCEANVVRLFPALDGGSTLNLVEDGGDTKIRFTALGGIFGDRKLAIDLCVEGQVGRRITITPIGRSKSHKPDSDEEDEENDPDC